MSTLATTPLDSARALLTSWVGAVTNAGLVSMAWGCRLAALLATATLLGPPVSNAMSLVRASVYLVSQDSHVTSVYQGSLACHKLDVQVCKMYCCKIFQLL